LITLTVKKPLAAMSCIIGGQEMKGYGEAFHADDGHVTITISGRYDVTFSSQSGFGIYGGTWGSGGTEQLIPASPSRATHLLDPD
jgi:hypothetical protein